MKRRYDPAFIKALKKADVRIRKSFRERIAIFAKNPLDPQLNNHDLHKPYEDLRRYADSSRGRFILVR